MAFSFDEGRPDRFRDRMGHYTASASPALSSAAPHLARAGTGAALFTGAEAARRALSDAGALVIIPNPGGALLSAGSSFRDFSLEFWFYPMNMENGEQILSWSSTRHIGRGDYRSQRILCVAARNRLEWTFGDFFSAPGAYRPTSFTLKGSVPISPRTWTHHLIRFDGDTGLLEYLVNGNPEDILYVTGTGREGGEVYTPVIGDEGALVLGGRFMGLIDELMIHRRYLESPRLAKYSGGGGRIETRFLDLGEPDSEILRIEASGGRMTIGGRSPGREQGSYRGQSSNSRIRNEYAGISPPDPAETWLPSGGGQFSFSDDSALQFFVRAGDAIPELIRAEWMPIDPGTDLTGSFRGRFVQAAIQFYPSGDGETAPYLEELRIVYRPNEPPVPPALVTAMARDGAVELSWRRSVDPDTAGYLVYYGTSRGEYFGEGAIMGVSPIDVGKRTAIRIDGLRNGVLYYFAVAAYDRIDPVHCGEFSREVSARPLRMAE
jgi:hypothetical protein